MKADERERLAQIEAETPSTLRGPIEVDAAPRRLFRGASGAQARHPAAQLWGERAASPMADA
jgi:hypothetical protein